MTFDLRPLALAPALLAAMTLAPAATAQDAGEFLGVFADGGGLSYPAGLKFGPDGHLYVCSTGTDQVLRYDGATGAFLDVFASGGGLNGPLGLVFGPDGDLYVTSNATRQVLEFDGLTGAFLRVVADEIPFNPLFLDFGPDGYLYFAAGVIPGRIHRCDPVTGTFSLFGTVPYASHGVTFGTDGYLYATNYYSPNNGVYRFDISAGGRTLFTSPSPLWEPRGLTFGPNGDLYVCSSTTNQGVMRFDGSTGAFLDVYVGPEYLSGPNDVVFGPDGHLYVTSALTHDVQRYAGPVPPTAEETIVETIGAVDALVASGTLKKGKGKSLNAKLNEALAKLDTQPTVALNKLGNFIDQVSGLVNAGTLPAEDGEELIMLALEAIALIEGT